MRNRVWQSAVTSDDHWDFWSLDRSNETALCLIKSLLSVLLLPSSVFIAPSFNPLLLSVSQFICSARCCLSSAVDSLSLYVARFFYFVRFVPWKPGSSCITAPAWKVGWPARGRVALLSDADATGMMEVADQRRCRLQPDLCLLKSTSEWRAFFLFAILQSWITRTLLRTICHRARVNKADLRVNIGRTGGLISVIDIPPFCPGAIFNTSGLLTSLIIGGCDCTVLGQVPEKK